MWGTVLRIFVAISLLTVVALTSKLWLEDSEGRKLLEAKGNFLGKNFEVKDMDGKLKAKIGKSDFFKDLVLGGLFDFSDTYAIKILDPSYDKRLLLGFVIAIDNSVHDKK